MRTILIVGDFTSALESASGARVAALAEGLKEHDYRVSLLTMERFGDREDRRFFGCRVKRSRNGGGALTTVFSELKDKPPRNGPLRVGLGFALRTILFLHLALGWMLAHREGNILLYGHRAMSLVVLACIARLLGHTVVRDVTEWELNANEESLMKSSLSFLEHKILPRLVTGLSVITPELSRKLPPGTEFAVVSGLLPTVWREQFSVRREDRSRSEFFRCFFSGSELEGMQELEASLAIISQRFPDIQFDLLIAGRAILPEETSAKRPPNLRVSALGFLDPTEYASILMETDCAIIPGRIENGKPLAFPNRLPEYLYSGTPTILSGYPSASELIGPLKIARLASYASVDCLVPELEWVLLNPVMSSEMGNRARRISKRLFDPRRNVIPLIELLHSKNEWWVKKGL